MAQRSTAAWMRRESVQPLWVAAVQIGRTDGWRDVGNRHGQFGGREQRQHGVPLRLEPPFAKTLARAAVIRPRGCFGTFPSLIGALLARIAARRRSVPATVARDSLFGGLRGFGTRLAVTKRTAAPERTHRQGGDRQQDGQYAPHTVRILPVQSVVNSCYRRRNHDRRPRAEFLCSIGERNHRVLDKVGKTGKVPATHVIGSVHCNIEGEGRGLRAKSKMTIGLALCPQLLALSYFNRHRSGFGVKWTLPQPGNRGSTMVKL